MDMAAFEEAPAIPCRYVEVHDNLGTIVGAGIDTYWFPELPADVQVLVAIPLAGIVEEFEERQQHTLVNYVKDPRGEVIGEGRGGFAAEVQLARPDFLAGILLPLGVRFPATEEGSYSIEFVVDDSGPTTTLPIHIVHGTR